MNLQLNPELMQMVRWSSRGSCCPIDALSRRQGSGPAPPSRSRSGTWSYPDKPSSPVKPPRSKPSSHRSGLRAIAFVTKRGEGSFAARERSRRSIALPNRE
jgi:hypothetical protein